MRITADKQLGVAKQYLLELKDELGATVVDEIVNAKQVLESETGGSTLAGTVTKRTVEKNDFLTCRTPVIGSRSIGSS
jgi:hypothetical protein